MTTSSTEGPPEVRLRATVVGLFPEIVTGPAQTSILGRAQSKGTLVVEGLQLRDFATDKHRSVDGSPAGGGPGMVLKVDVLAAAIRAATGAVDERNAASEAQDDRDDDDKSRPHVILMDAAGKRFCQADARRLASHSHLVFVCGRYEGVDARVHAYVDEVLSIGDFVLTGGELAAGVVLDAVARHVPGVLGNQMSSEVESHEQPRLEHRQYTRPASFEGVGLPPVLFGGNHPLIARARQKDGVVRTQKMRPDLIGEAPLTSTESALLKDAKVPSLDASDVDDDDSETSRQQKTNRSEIEEK